MTHFVQRSVLILLAGTALSAGASPGHALAQAYAAPPEAVAAPGVDAAARTKSKRADDTYTVRRGDTLAKVADRMGTDIETLAKLNGLKKPYRLDVGDVIKGPGADKAPAKAAAKSSGKGASKVAPEPAADKTYTVRSGDTLYAIAQRMGTTVQALQAANDLGRSSSLMPGRKLRMPGSGGAAEAEAEAPPEPTPRRGRATPATVERAERVPSGEREVTGRVVSIEIPGKAYRVKKGDTLEKIARRLDGDIDDLARINKLKKPYRLQPGQTIRAAGDTAKAYVVGRGDTLAEIAQRFGVSVDQLRTANGLRRGAAVAPGRKLRLPAGYRDRGPIASPVREPEPRPEPEVRREPEPARQAEPRREPEPPPRPRSSFETPPPVGQTQPPPRSAQPSPSEALPTRPQPYTPSGRAPSRPAQTYTPQGSVNGAPTASPPVSDAQIMQMGRGLFIWPVRGEVLSDFGAKGAGQRNDGVNIRANTGDPVRAAADGDVVYAGDQVPGFGNLVLVKHADGWVTAYGHLSRVGVRMQQKVTQGQEIGQAGSSGGVTEPQVHFEVRYAPSPQERARPVDPALVLPK